MIAGHDEDPIHRRPGGPREILEEPDLYEPALHCSTTGMIAANVIFGDYEVALQLADRLMRHGISAPQSDAPEIQPEL